MEQNDAKLKDGKVPQAVVAPKEGATVRLGAEGA